MKKILFIKIIVVLAVVVTVLSGTVLFVVPRREIYQLLFEQQGMEAQVGMSAFEAQLNYDGILQQIAGNQKVTGLMTYVSSDDLRDKIIRLHEIYQCSKWLCGIGFLLAIVGLIILRKQKWHDCLLWGGIASIGISALTVLPLYLVKSLRLFFFGSQYEEYLGYDPILVSILPKDWALYTWLGGAGLAIVIGVILILFYFGSRKEYKPHQF